MWVCMLMLLLFVWCLFVWCWCCLYEHLQHFVRWRVGCGWNARVNQNEIDELAVSLSCMAFPLFYVLQLLSAHSLLDELDGPTGWVWLLLNRYFFNLQANPSLKLRGSGFRFWKDATDGTNGGASIHQYLLQQYNVRSSPPAISIPLLLLLYRWCVLQKYYN